MPPGDRPLREVQVNGKPIQTFTSTLATINEFPADVIVGTRDSEDGAPTSATLLLDRE